MKGQAADSLIKILLEKRVMNSDSLWFSIEHLSSISIPPPDGYEDIPLIGYAISVGTSIKKKQEYIESEQPNYNSLLFQKNYTKTVQHIPPPKS